EDPYDMNVTRMDSHGGWIARPADLVQVLMHATGLAEPALLAPQTIVAMTTGSSVNSGYAKGWVINTRYDNWWHNGSLPGTSTLAVRTHGGFCWAAFTNTRRRDSKLDGDLDALNWNMVRSVASWHVA